MPGHASLVCPRRGAVAVDGVGSVKKTVKVENPACMLPG